MIVIESIDGAQWVAVIRAMADAVMAKKSYLSTLDSMIGDGDHGVSLAKALDDAAQQVRALPDPSPESVLRTAGSAVQNAMGGASGILFGSFFVGMARGCAGKPSVTQHEIAAMLFAGLAAVQKRSKAERGDKTMVDALSPAVEAAQIAIAANRSLTAALGESAEAAQAGAESTKNLIAKFGRAKFLGARSLGHQDAGATSMSIMLSALAETLKGDI